MTRRGVEAHKNRVAIVASASSGIGRATAFLFASEGAAVIVGARREAALDTLVAEIEAMGGYAARVAGDVRDGGWRGVDRSDVN